MGKGRKSTAAAVMALILGLGVTPALAQQDGARILAQLEMLSRQPQELFKQGKYAEALAAAEEWAKAARQAESARGGRPDEKTVAALTSVSWNALFTRRFERALEAADQALALMRGHESAQANRAHALMFLGRADDALAIYVEYKGVTLSGQGKWEDILAKDFAELRKAGLDHPLMARVGDAIAAAPESPVVLLQKGTGLLSAYKFPEAISEYENYVRAVKARRGENHPDYAEALRLLGGVLELAKRHDEAGTRLRQALELDERNLGADHPSVAEDLSKLAGHLSELKQVNDAEAFYRRAMAIAEKYYGPEHARLTDILHNLAKLLEEENRFEDAESLYRKSLSIIENNYGPSHKKMGDQLQSLGWFLMEQGKFADAEPMLKRALEIGETNFGPDHPLVSLRLTYLALLYQKTNRLAEAEPLLRRALAIDEKTFGPDHKDVATSLKSLAAVLQEMNRLAEAETLLRRALAIFEKSSGPESPAVSASLNNLALMLMEKGRFADAEPLLRRALAITEKNYGREHPKLNTGLSNLAVLLGKTNRLAEAEPLLRRALAIAEKTYGPEHLEVVSIIGNLAHVLNETNRHAEAEPLYLRALAIDEKIYGPEHPEVALRLNNLATLYGETNRLAEAEPLMRRALAIEEKSRGPEHPELAVRLHNLAHLFQETNRYAEAEPLCLRALAIIEKSYGLEHPEMAPRLNQLASLYEETNRHAEAETLYRRALAVAEKGYGPEHPQTAIYLNNLALHMQHANRLAEAEHLLQRSLAISEKSYGPEHPEVATSLNNLAQLYRDMNRLDEAEQMTRRDLAIVQKSLGLDHPKVATGLNNLAWLMKDARRPGEAEPLFRQALAIYEKSYGPEHPQVALALNNLATLMTEDMNRHREAEPLFRRSLAIREKSFGPEHPDVANTMIPLSALLRDTGRFVEAEALIRRALAIYEKSYGPGHPDVAYALEALARLQGKRGQWPEALQNARRSSSIRIASVLQMRGVGGGQGEKGLLSKNARRFREHALIAYRAAHADPNVLDEAFASAQRAAASEAAGALAQASARFASGNDALAALAREQQDLARQREGTDKRLLAALNRADRAAAEAAHAEQARLDARLNEVSARLAKEYPDYAALMNPEPLAVAAVQQMLAPDEALAQFLDLPLEPGSPFPETAFAFVIARTEARWIELPLGARELGDQVDALRCGLDSAAWKEGANRCAQLLGRKWRGDDLPPFDLARAHALYHALFGQVEELITDKRLLIAASGALTRLPFQVLATEAPDPAFKGAEAYARARWLGARNAISVLPSAASLKLLRLGKQGSASDPFLGFGNPLLNGGGDRSAWRKQACAKTTALQSVRRSVNRAAPPALAEVYRGAIADVEMLRQAQPLPETADELCAVAHDLGAPDSSVYLGERATVSKIKSLSASGALARARIIHFATHGLMAGETALFLRNRAEPALLMTPPEKDKAAPEDDGLLKASDVTQLRLNADWVVMSACNTAAGGEGGEALSGLARAFFYAGARSMLVSHWYVNSSAAVAITTGAFAALKAEPGIGRDEALRRSLSGMIAKGGDNAHPSVWAPFVLVGDGGRTASLGGQEGKASAAGAPTAAQARVLKLDGAGGQTIAGLAFSPDGGQLLGATPDGIAIWDARTGSVVRTLSANGSRIFGFSADGRLLAVASGSRAAITLWDAEHGKPKAFIAASESARFSRDAVALSPDGQRLAAEQYGASPSGPTVGVWDVRTGGLTRLLEGRISDVRALVFSSDGRRLAVIDAKGALSVWDADAGKAAFAPIAFAAAKLAAFSADGLTLASAGAGGAVRLWDAQTGRQIGAVASQTETVKSLAFSPDGRMIALGRADGAVELRETSGSISNANGR